MPDFPTLAGGAIQAVTHNTAASQGVSVADAAQDTKGAWTQLIAATTYDTAWVLLQLLPNALDAFLVDIGVGASTAEKVLIPDILAGASVSLTTVVGREALFPVAIPAGTRLSARCASSTTLADTVFVGTQLIAAPLASPPGGSRVEGFGSTPTGSTGTVVDPGGTINTPGTWTQLIASTGFDYRWLCLQLTGNAVTATTWWLLDIGLGANPNEKVVVPQLAIGSYGSVDRPYPQAVALPVFIPAGSRVSVSARCSINTVTERNLIVCGQGVG